MDPRTRNAMRRWAEGQTQLEELPERERRLYEAMVVRAMGTLRQDHTLEELVARYVSDEKDFLVLAVRSVVGENGWRGDFDLLENATYYKRVREMYVRGELKAERGQGLE